MMKKYFFYAALAAVAMTSCSSDDDVANVIDPTVDPVVPEVTNVSAFKQVATTNSAFSNGVSTSLSAGIGTKAVSADDLGKGITGAEVTPNEFTVNLDLSRFISADNANIVLQADGYNLHSTKKVPVYEQGVDPTTGKMVYATTPKTEGQEQAKDSKGNAMFANYELAGTTATLPEVVELNGSKQVSFTVSGVQNLFSEANVANLGTDSVWTLEVYLWPATKAKQQNKIDSINKITTVPGVTDLAAYKEAEINKLPFYYWGVNNLTEGYCLGEWGDMFVAEDGAELYPFGFSPVVDKKVYAAGFVGLQGNAGTTTNTGHDKWGNTYTTTNAGSTYNYIKVSIHIVKNGVYFEPVIAIPEKWHTGI